MRTLAAVLALLSASAFAQPNPASPPPPQGQDAFLRQLSETRNFNSGRPVFTRITPDEKTVLFLRSAPTSNVLTLFAFDVATGQARELLTPEGLLHGAEETLSAAEKARRERMRVRNRGFTSYELSQDGDRILLSLSGRLYVSERASGKVTELATEPGVIDPHFSPDGKQVAYVRDNDVHRVDLSTGKEKRVTTGGTADKTHGLAEFIAQEEMGRFSGYWWSPDAKFIAYAESDTSGVEKLTLVDPANPERGGDTVAYPRPGKPNAKVRLGIIPTAGGKTTWVEWDSNKHPYLVTVKWNKGGPLTLVVQNREQTEEQVLAVDVRTGKTRSLHTETDEAWLNIDPDFPLWLEDGSGFLWFTERNGGPEVELRKADGGLVRSLVGPDAGFRDLVRYVEKEETLYFLGGTNPTERYLWRVKKGEPPARVTSEAGGPAMESGLVSGKGGLLVVTSEGPRSLRRFQVLKADGTRVGELPSVAQEPPLIPNLEVRQVGPRKFWASIVRPRDFKPGVKLPVIVEVYGAAFPIVQQSMAQSLMPQWMADQGFLIVRIDGRGTQMRGREWDRALKYDFASIPLEDLVAGRQALAAEVPELDLGRVGIEGWSHGGYTSAMAVLRRPDIFKAAVAGAPVTDWRDYDTHVPERYLGLPEKHPEAYEKSSLLTYVKADAPMGKLLLIHGTADDNVFFSHTLKLSDALFRAGQPHEILPLSGFTHMVFDPLVSERRWHRVMRHFKENL